MSSRSAVAARFHLAQRIGFWADGTSAEFIPWLPVCLRRYLRDSEVMARTVFAPIFVVRIRSGIPMRRYSEPSILLSIRSRISRTKSFIGSIQLHLRRRQEI